MVIYFVEDLCVVKDIRQPAGIDQWLVSVGANHPYLLTFYSPDKPTFEIGARVKVTFEVCDDV